MKTKILASTIACLVYCSAIQAAGILPAPGVSGLTPKAVKVSALAVLTKNIEYATAKPTIRDTYYENLDKLAKVITEENYAVSLRGHADAIGGYKYNWVLSDKRAISVKEYLVSKGVKSSNIITTPYGSTVPIASNKTVAGRQKNRRVEIQLKKINK